MMKTKILELRQNGIDNNVPIIKDDGLLLLLDTINSNNYKSVLEIGTAIGYSAINMALTGAKVTTIERDINMYNEAIKNIKDFNLENQINCVFKDALDAYSLVSNAKYDLIFIDAAKAQYQKFFDIYINLLNPNGIVFCDNMDFHGMTTKPLEELTKGLRGIVRKLNAFKTYLDNLKGYTVNYYHIGDGVAIIRKDL